MHNKYIITYECHDNALRMWKVVQLEKYFDFSLYSHHFSLLSFTSLLSAPEREVTSPSDFKVVGALIGESYFLVKWKQCQINFWMYLCYCHKIKSVIDSRWTVSISCWQNRPTKEFKPVSTSTFKTPDWVYHFIIYHNIDWYDTKCTLLDTGILVTRVAYMCYVFSSTNLCWAGVKIYRMQSSRPTYIKSRDTFVLKTVQINDLGSPFFTKRITECTGELLTFWLGLIKILSYKNRWHQGRI